MPTNQRATSAKRQREQDQKERAAERIARRSERKARAAARVASGQVGPQIGEPAPPENDLDFDPTAPPGDPAARPRPPERPTMSGRRLYVGNLSFDTSGDAIRALFAKHGEVADVHVVLDQVTRRPRGFAFVTMGSPTEAQAAMDDLDGQTVDGRTLRVNEAEGREGGGGGGGRGRF